MIYCLALAYVVGDFVVVKTSNSAIPCFSLAKTGSASGCYDSVAVILRLSGMSFRLKSLQAHAMIDDIRID